MKSFSAMVLLFVLAATQPVAAIQGQNTFLGSSERPIPAEALSSVMQRLREGQQWVHGKVSEPVTMIALQLKHKFLADAGVEKQEPGLQPGVQGQVNQPPQPTMGQIILNMVVTAIIFLLVAFLYTKYKPDFVTPDNTDSKESLNGDFKHGLCSCFETPGLAFFSCCCGGIRWADTMRMAGMLAFVYGIGIFLFLESTSGVLGGLTWLLVAVLGTMYRQKLRTAFNMQSGSDVMLYDCLKWCCCGCCAIVQEARQMEEARVLGHDAADKEMPLDFST